MEGDETELTSEKERLIERSCLVSTPNSVSLVLKSGKTDACDENWTNQQVTLSPVTHTKTSTQECHRNCDINVTLENESAWNRFHCLGTEMILTKQGRRMFPCCRFRLSGLDLQRKYFLVMEIMPLDNFTHKWNGKTWEPVAEDEPHEMKLICIHPQSPALGQQWMESPVSFYKVKLTNVSIDQEDCVLLRPMRRYLPRLHIVPVDPDSEGTIPFDGPFTKVFSFPQTEFYAVTSYQNPQTTQLKLECNPFAMAFREDSQNTHLQQDKFRLCSSLGTHFRSPLLSVSRNLIGKRKERTVKSTAPTCTEENRIKDLCPGTAILKEGEEIFNKMRNATLSCPNNMTFCQENADYSESDGGNEADINKCPGEPLLDLHIAPLHFEPSVTVPLEEPLASTDVPVPPVDSIENPKSLESSEGAVNNDISCTNSELSPSMVSPDPQPEREMKSVSVSLHRTPFLNSSQVHKHKPTRFRHRHNQRGRKSKCWTNIKHTKQPPAAVPVRTGPVQPDLEDVEGMLFVSFVAKEALNSPVENIKESQTILSPSSPTHEQPDNHVAEDGSFSMEERIAKLEKNLLLYLKQQKHKQLLHPYLQDVGMKLNLLDPTLPIDLQYLGIHLPLPPPVHEGLDKMNPMNLSSSPDPTGSFLSRTGKTNDPTKIKGWRDKFKSSTVQSAPEGLKNSSAFCSEMLDAYLENEAQHISNHVDVFSKCSAPPVSYQLPSKSSSYVVTLDSLLKTRSASSNKVHGKPMVEILPKSCPNTAVPLSSASFKHGLQRNQEKGINFEHSFQAHENAASTVQANRSMSFVSRCARKKNPVNYQQPWSSSGGTESHISNVSSSVITIKVTNQTMLQEMEEEAISHGKVRTHVTTERAKYALTSLLKHKKPGKWRRFPIHHKDENSCPKVFCRLGCVCESLDREIRGPTHCQRVDCMFHCSCFKHKVLVLHPSKQTATVHRGRKRSVLAFSIADRERESRPPPAPSVNTLWKKNMQETDPEPLFIPVSSKTVPPLRRGLTQSTRQVQDEDKDPVYLYFESMMTCARVREYNSNPPPQIHMFPNKEKKSHLEQLIELSKAASSSHMMSETSPTETPGEPKPTKMLEIISECNWEPHRSEVLSMLFQRMNRNSLSEPFCFGMYKVQLLSAVIKGVGRSSTVTYKVCISRADEKEMTKDLLPPPNKIVINQSLKDRKSTNTHAPKAGVDSGQKSTALVEQQQQKPLSNILLRTLPFCSHAATIGYLKADKKNPESPTQGLIKVHGKTYNQAKLLLGQLGALHPVNRVAAFVTGRQLQDQSKISGDATKTCPPEFLLMPCSGAEVANASNPAPSNSAVARPSLAKAPEPDPVSKNTRSNTSVSNALSNILGKPPGKTPTVPDGTKFILVPVTPNSAAAPRAGTVSSSTLPPGQQVVLQPATGMSGSNNKKHFYCQYNGQIIQLTPISSGPHVQPQRSSVKKGSILQVKALESSTPLTNVLPKPIPVITPKAHSLSATSGMNIVNGMPPLNLQSRFPGKTGIFSFRICPPTSEKLAGSGHGGNPPQTSDNSSTLILPGGFTLIKLYNPTVPVGPVNVISTASHSAEIPKSNENMKTSVLQSCFTSLEQSGQVSESIINPTLSETLNSKSAQGAADGLSQSSKGLTLENDEVNICKSENIATSGKHDCVPEGVEMVHTMDAIKMEPKHLDDWPPKGTEMVHTSDLDPKGLDNWPPKGTKMVHTSDLDPKGLDNWPPKGTEMVHESDVSEMKPNDLGHQPPKHADMVHTSEMEHTSEMDHKDLDDWSPCGVENEYKSDVSELDPKALDDWPPKGAEMVHQSDDSEMEPKDLDAWPPNGAERILWVDSADENGSTVLNEELNNKLDVAAVSSAAEEASESKNTRKTLETNFKSCDVCLHVDELSVNAGETVNPPQIHENGFPSDDACSKSPPVEEQNHLKYSKPKNDQENDCHPLDNAVTFNTAKINKQAPPLSDLIKNNKLSGISPVSLYIREQEVIHENCPLVLKKNKKYNETTEMDVTANEPNIKTQGLMPESCTFDVSKKESFNSQTGGADRFLIIEKRLDFDDNYGVSVNVESCNDSPETDACSMHDDTKQRTGSEDILPVINSEEPSVSQTVIEGSSHLSKQGLDSKNSVQILSHKKCNNPETTVSPREECNENIDIAGNAPCTLMDGQTPVMFSPPTAQLLNTASLGQKSGLKFISPFPQNVHKSSPELSDDYSNISDNCTKTSKILKPELKEGHEEAEDRNKWLKSKTAVRRPSGSEEILVNEDEGLSDESDSDDTSSDDDEADSHGDKEVSSKDSTSDSETTVDAALDESNEDDIDIESFDDSYEESIRDVLKNETWHKKDAAKLKKKIKSLTSILSEDECLPMHDLEKRMRHTEKERVRREELRHSFDALGKAMNVQVKMSKHDILNQARLTIRALEDRSHCLKERKRGLFQKQSGYVSRILQLSEGRKKSDVKKLCERQNQKTSISGPLSNPQRLDSDARRRPPRSGRRRALSYIHKKSQKAFQQTSVTTTVVADESLDRHLSPNRDNHAVNMPLVKTVKPSLPNIVLQSIDMLKFNVRRSQAGSSEDCNTAKPLTGGDLELQDPNEETEQCDATRMSNKMEKILMSELSNKESPISSSTVAEIIDKNNILSKLEDNKQASAAVVKVRKKIGKSEVDREEVLSNPDPLEPRQLRRRQRVPAVNKRATRGGSGNKRKRFDVLD